MNVSQTDTSPKFPEYDSEDGGAFYGLHKDRLVIKDKELGISCIDGEEYVPFLIDHKSAILEEKYKLQESKNKHDYSVYCTYNGVKHGESVCFSRKGMIKEQCFYKKGQLHGPSSYFFAEGMLSSQSWFFEGKKQGKTFRYAKNGSLLLLLQFVNGLFQGEQKKWSSSRSLVLKASFQKGLLHGQMEMFFLNGSVWRRAYFSEGRRFGWDIVWDLKGDIVSELYFQEDLVDKSVSYDQIARQYQLL